MVIKITITSVTEMYISSAYFFLRYFVVNVIEIEKRQGSIHTILHIFSSMYCYIKTIFQFTYVCIAYICKNDSTIHRVLKKSFVRVVHIFGVLLV